MIETALISTQDGCTYIPEPKLPENPYNREPFNYFEYLKIWTKFKDLNIKSTLFQLFYEADFNLNCFKNRNSKMLFDLSFDRFFSRLSLKNLVIIIMKQWNIVNLFTIGNM